MADLDVTFLLTFGVSLVAVIISYVDMRRRFKKQQEFSKSFVGLVNTLREELQLFRKKSMTSDDLKRQKLLAQKEQQQWKRMSDIAKAIGWILEHAE